MELEYRNGVRITKFAHEKDAFEAALDEYERRLTDYYKDPSRSRNETKRRKATAEAMHFLNMERAKLNTISSIQAQLREYRAIGMNGADENSDIKTRVAASRMMIAEEHHPTEVLEENMAAEGVPKPSAKHSAHHICPGKGKLPELTRQTRVHIHSFGVRINDPANGVYLLTYDASAPHWSMPDSRGHRTYHTHDYERMVWERIIPLMGQDEIKTQLQVIGRLMQQHNVKVMIDKAGGVSLV